MKPGGAWKAAPFLLASSAAYGQVLTLVNPLNVDRRQEVIEIPLQRVLDELHAGPVQAPAIVAEDAKTGQHLPDQFFSATYGAPPDTLLVLVRLAAQLRGHPVSR